MITFLILYGKLCNYFIWHDALRAIVVGGKFESGIRVMQKFDYFVMLEISREGGGGACTFSTQGRQSNIFGSNISGKVRYCFVQGLSIKSDNSGLKWVEIVSLFRNSCKSDAIVDMILPGIFGSSSRNLMIFLGRGGSKI